MNIGNAYGGPGSIEISLYLPANIVPPEELILHDTITDRDMQFVRLSDASLNCLKITGGCGGYDCHRITLGACKCGAHKNARPTRAAPGEPNNAGPGMTAAEKKRALDRKKMP